MLRLNVRKQIYVYTVLMVVQYRVVYLKMKIYHMRTNNMDTKYLRFTVSYYVKYCV